MHRNTLKRAAGAVVGGLALGLTGLAVPASAAEPAFFPGVPSPTQITKDLTLAEAAQAGVIKLSAKGGSEGDVMALELKNTKDIKAPITVTIRVEMTVKPELTPQFREAIRDLVPYFQQQVEGELNRRPNTTSSGQTVKFKIDYKWREPEESPRANYHQVLLIDPRRDLDVPDPQYRSGADEMGHPNTSDVVYGTFSILDPSPLTFAHETLHIAGLGDRYTDFYRVGGKDYPLPETGMDKRTAAQWAHNHQPPLPTNGTVVVKNVKGTDPCDQMGTGFERPCRKIVQKDLDFFGQQAGLQVAAQPGDLLLSKDPSKQNFGVGFGSIIFASPGSTTVANGISVYCLDHDRVFPITGDYDVGPAATQMPGYENVVKLLQLNARVQPSLTEPVEGMQAALWNITDAQPVTASGYATEARALLAQAGVGENSRPGGLPAIPNPAAALPGTAAVDTAGTVLPETVAEPITEAPAAMGITTTSLLPSPLRAGPAVKADLIIGTSGDARQLALRIDRQSGRRWKPTRRLPMTSLTEVDATGIATIPVTLGKLVAGRYRLVLAVTGPVGDPVVQRVAFRVR